MKDDRVMSKVFYYFKNKYDARKKCFKNMIQTENVMMFYRMASAFAAIERKNFAKKVDGKKK